MINLDFHDITGEADYLGWKQFDREQKDIETILSDEQQSDEQIPSDPMGSSLTA